MSMLMDDISIIIPFLFVAFVLVFYAMCIRYVGAASARSRTFGAIIGNPRGASGLVKLPKGMSSDVVRTFLIFAYSEMKNVGNGLLPRAVCLSEFKEGDFVRMLPKCGHGFHPECIDMWLSDHVTCPVCRTNLVLNADGNVVQPSEINHVETISARNNDVVVRIDDPDQRVLVTVVEAMSVHSRVLNVLKYNSAVTLGN